MHLEIDRSDIRNTRIVDTSAPTLHDGQVLMSIEAFALTSNNISYALSGDMLDYWGFFPTEQGWGRLPVMGFAVVTESMHNDIAVGGRYFGFYPAGDHHVVDARASAGGFVDAAAHRDNHAMAYRTFDRFADSPSPTDHRYLLLRGLFVTSYLAEDFLFDNAMFGAAQIVVSSASSKTALALAQRIRARGNTHCIGLTSPTNRGFVDGTALYDEVVTYDEIDTLAEWAPTIYVDMAGNASVNAAVHAHFDEALVHSMAIGATHWDQTGANPALPGPKPQFFFAPTQLAKRGKEWGRERLEREMGSALDGFIEDSQRWMNVEVSRGASGLESIYRTLVLGGATPESGHIISP